MSKHCEFVKARRLEIIRLLDEGVKPLAIAKTLKSNRETIMMDISSMRQEGLIVMSTRKGNHIEARREAIKELFKKGKSCIQIALRFSVTVGTVYNDLRAFGLQEQKKKGCRKNVKR